MWGGGAGGGWGGGCGGGGGVGGGGGDWPRYPEAGEGCVCVCLCVLAASPVSPLINSSDCVDTG